MSANDWAGRGVFLTGSTGFKGTWLSLWLQELGAKVTGYSLPPPTSPSLFEAVRAGESIHWTNADIRNRDHVAQALRECGPQVVFHLAAQPLVRASYDQPIETFETNVIGTANVLEAVREVPSVRAVVVITTDKCYENREWCWPYRENDPLGGRDPYSASKACAEIVTSAYARSFLLERGIGVATVRAGNVIGGGDWAPDRLVPDAVRALTAGEGILVRNPASVRPWQHVLEPLQGYVTLAERLLDDPATYSRGWNFGPVTEAIRPVSDVVKTICQLWGPGAQWYTRDVAQPHEAQLLTLDSSLARSKLGWRPRLSFSEGIAQTVAWYKAHHDGRDMRDFSVRQLKSYQEDQT